MIEDKILGIEDLQQKVQGLKSQGRRIVFTNGCFDVIHYGHVKYLEDAKKLGDILIVGVNSDLSVKQIKSPERPIMGEAARARLVAALESVDYVVLFDEDTPLKLIKAVIPNVLVKGGDWDSKYIAGSDVVKENGGEVKTIKFVDGYSSTEIIDRIKNILCKK